MNLLFIVNLLYQRNRMLKHDKWSREELEQFQTESLAKLRDHAYSDSPFYKRLHRGMWNGPLTELPVLTKKEMMDNFDEIVTDRRIKLNNVYDYLTNLQGSDPYLGKYRVSSTSGSTGLKGIFPFGETEWATAAASYLRASDWSGVSVNLTKRLKVAVVGSTSPWHTSSQIGGSLNSWWVSTINLDTTKPIEEIVSALNEFQPQCLMAYSNSARLLAEQQISGELKISPKAVFCTSEVLTEDSRSQIYQAFGVQPFNVYASTETAGFASSCSHHKGLHLFEDLIITEVVNDDNIAVPNGKYGTKILVTVLSSRTIPLIRYEVSDSIKLETDECPCGLPYRLIGDIQGRREETLYFPGHYGKLVRIEPNLFHKVMEIVPAAGWQIIQDTQDSIKVLVREPRHEYSEDLLKRKLQFELENEGVTPTISIEYVDRLNQTKSGKIILIKALTK